MGFWLGWNGHDGGILSRGATFFGMTRTGATVEHDSGGKMCSDTHWISSMLRESMIATKQFLPHLRASLTDPAPQHPGDVLRYERFVRLAARGTAGRTAGEEP